MTVFWVIKEGVASNSLGIPKIPFSDVAYAINCKPKIFVLKPIIDKLSCVFDFVDEGLKEHVCDQLQYFSSFAGPPEYQDTSYKTKHFGIYKTSVSLVAPDSQQAILIQAQPKTQKTKNFMRFAFNPSKLGPVGMAFFREQISDLFKGTYSYKNIAKDGHVTRVDIAVDMVNIPIDDILIVTKEKEKSHVYYGVDGGTETIYLGASKFNKTGHTAIYDKQQQLYDVGRDQKFGGLPITRIEARPKTYHKIVSLQYLVNPFSDIEVYIPGVVTPPESADHWAIFLDSCRHAGIGNALAKLPADLKPKYSAALEEAKTSTWEPDKIWDYWPEALKSTGLLDGI